MGALVGAYKIAATRVRKAEIEPVSDPGCHRDCHTACPNPRPEPNVPCYTGRRHVELRRPFSRRLKYSATTS